MNLLVSAKDTPVYDAVEGPLMDYFNEVKDNNVFGLLSTLSGDYEKAIEHVKKDADKDLFSKYNLGWMLELLGEEEKAFKIYHECSEYCHPMALMQTCALGDFDDEKKVRMIENITLWLDDVVDYRTYEKWEDVPESLATLNKLSLGMKKLKIDPPSYHVKYHSNAKYYESFEAGHIQGMMEKEPRLHDFALKHFHDCDDKTWLGECYYYGIGVEKDIQRAIRIYESNGKKSFAFSNYNLGMMYFLGEEIKQDLEKANYYFKRSAKKGHSIAALMAHLLDFEPRSWKKNENGIF